ncbi:hypothetical protein CK203_110642 [Vitis vinifera]|uniref:Uncharacterized protein n=1 Tax=Vitis vinifera TaxID=29760 RepID=A0A438CD26_VITVI|nr:hypothetical protein CK203_110642 [Vitis vinifera]
MCPFGITPPGAVSIIHRKESSRLPTSHFQIFQWLFPSFLATVKSQISSPYASSALRLGPIYIVIIINFIGSCLAEDSRLCFLKRQDNLVFGTMEMVGQGGEELEFCFERLVMGGDGRGGWAEAVLGSLRVEGCPYGASAADCCARR